MQGAVNNMSIEHRQKFHGCMKGISPAVLRKLVKGGGQNGSRYLINTNPGMLVVLISDRPDLDRNNKMEVERANTVAREKKLGQEACLKEVLAATVRKMKEGPHL